MLTYDGYESRKIFWYTVHLRECHQSCSESEDYTHDSMQDYDLSLSELAYSFSLYIYYVEIQNVYY
jgi:hypothetical protein